MIRFPNGQILLLSLLMTLNWQSLSKLAGTIFFSISGNGVFLAIVDLHAVLLFVQGMSSHHMCACMHALQCTTKTRGKKFYNMSHC